MKIVKDRNMFQATQNLIRPSSQNLTEMNWFAVKMKHDFRSMPSAIFIFAKNTYKFQMVHNK
jgi:hypothetical protein